MTGYPIDGVVYWVNCYESIYKLLFFLRDKKLPDVSLTILIELFSLIIITNNRDLTNWIRLDSVGEEIWEISGI